MKKLTIALLLSLLTVSAMANAPSKTLSDEKATTDLCYSAAKAFNTASMDFKPVESLLAPYWHFGNIDPNKSLSAISHSSNQLIHVGLSLWGKPLDVLFVSTDKDKLGYFIRHNYMMRRENTALEFYCEFYKSNKGWHLITFRWHDNYQTFFD